jgi:hypothetical protein
MEKNIEVLEYEKKVLNKELNDIDLQKTKITKKISDLDKSIRDIKILKSKIKDDGIIVSDHALIRFLQRKIFSEEVLEEARQTLINDVKNKINSTFFINKKAQIKINLEYGSAVVKNNTVVTIM